MYNFSKSFFNFLFKLLYSILLSTPSKLSKSYVEVKRKDVNYFNYYFRFVNKLV